MSLGSKEGVQPGSYVPTRLSHVSKACFYVTLLVDESLIQTIKETLMETNEGAKENITSKCLSMGDLVSVLDEADQLWHRGQVTGCFGPLTEVFLIDSGKDIVAERNMLQELPNIPLVRDSPAQAIKCTLSDKNISIGHFVSMKNDVGRQFLTHFEHEEDGLWKVKLYVERVYSTKSLEKEVLNSSRSHNSQSEEISEDLQMGAGFKLCTRKSDSGTVGQNVCIAMKDTKFTSNSCETSGKNCMRDNGGMQLSLSGSCTGINFNPDDDDSTGQISNVNKTRKTSFYSNFEEKGHSKTNETRVSLRVPKYFGNYTSPEFHAELEDSQKGAMPSPSEEVCKAFSRSCVILKEQENVIVKTSVAGSLDENKTAHALCNTELDRNKEEKSMMNSVFNEALNDLPHTQNIDSKKCPSIPKAKKTCNVEFSAIISNFEEDGTVWVQAVDQISSLNKIMNQINEINTECLKIFKDKPCINSPCLSLYREDQRFYRAIVKDLTEDTDCVLVHYVDYGNSEITEVSSLRVIPDSFLDVPCKVIQCYFPMSLKEQLLGVFHKEIEKIFNEELKITLVEDPLEKDNLILKSCIVSGIDIVSRIHEEHKNNRTAPGDTIEGLSHESQVSEVSSTCLQIPHHSIKYDTEMAVYVTQVDSAGKFWVQILDNFSLIVEMMDKLNDFAVSSGRTTMSSPKIGKPCLCVYVKDEQFYRAEITKINPECSTAMVHYIDYGDTGEVEISDLFVLPEQFFTLPRQAICCYFSSKIRNQWSSSIQQYLEKLLEKEIYLTLTQELEGFKHRIVVKKLTLDGNDVISHITFLVTNNDSDGEVFTENYESQDMLCEEDIPEILLSGDGSVKGIVSHVEGSCIWIQLSDQITAIEEMQEKLNSSSLQPLAEVPFVGSVCISYFPEDERFYRAVVKEVDLSCHSVVVRYVDYGNSSHVEMKDLYVFPLDLMCLPKQAIQCYFSGNFNPCSEAFTKRMEKLPNQEVTVSFLPNFGEGGKNILHSCIVDNKDILLCERLNASNVEEGTESQ